MNKAMMIPAAYDVTEALKQADINKPVQFLYEQFFDVVTAVIRNNGGQADDAADVFQEAVLVLIDMVKTDRFRGDSSVKTFLIGIARNIWLQEMRSRSRRNNREQKYHNESFMGEAPDATHRIYDREHRHMLSQLFDAIGDTCRKILTGFYYENLSMREMLVQFNYENEQVLRNRKSKCMKKLKELISDNHQMSDTLNNILYYDK
jgi:RNA polymerase sigma factor (sigma-70 family)